MPFVTRPYTANLPVSIGEGPLRMKNMLSARSGLAPVLYASATMPRVNARLEVSAMPIGRNAKFCPLPPVPHFDILVMSRENGLPACTRLACTQ